MKLYRFKNGKCNAVGTQIKLLREHSGLSQEQLAAQLQLLGLNLNQKAVSRIETGDRVVPDYELLVFAQLFQTNIASLFPLSVTRSFSLSS